MDYRLISLRFCAIPFIMLATRLLVCRCDFVSPLAQISQAKERLDLILSITTLIFLPIIHSTARPRASLRRFKMAAKAAARPLGRIVSNVEVERKFNPGPGFAFHFFCNDRKAQLPAFTVLRQPSQLIRDTYYDTQDGRLSNLGLWVRKRYTRVLPFNISRLKTSDGQGVANESALLFATRDHETEKTQWNAKSRLGGHFNNSQFVELDGKQNVADEVLRISEAKLKLEDLQVVADLQTDRSSWEVTHLEGGTAPSAKMTIVMDQVVEAKLDEGRSDGSAFAHTIGEVELFQEFATEGKDRAEHEEQRKEVAAQRMAELKNFMLLNTDLFTTTPTPTGKLSAYFGWKTALRG
ncbi:hypothetical protein F4861DRAFT_522216 [Xylaria intraflava]|nr:hypothetical protein F4861DRAFT_522216 [Xylaria intraflava]